MRRGNLAVLCLATGLAVVPALTHADPVGPSEANVAAALMLRAEGLLIRFDRARDSLKSSAPPGAKLGDD